MAARTRAASLISPRSICPDRISRTTCSISASPRQAREALRRLGYDLDEILAQEEEPGLGNGGLGRLASCYMDSLASVEVPAIGYGIRYEFGIFDQVIRDGWQQEITDKWLRNGNPWEIPRSEIAYDVKFGGHTEAWTTSRVGIGCAGFPRPR